MKIRSVILAAIGASLLLGPQPASPQVLEKLWQTFKPPPFRGVKSGPAVAAPGVATDQPGTPAVPTGPLVIPTPGPGWISPDPENTLVVDTSKGQIIVELSQLIAPAYVERIKILTRAGFYDGRKFFRVIDGFMDQTGDPDENGEGGSALPDLKGEFTFHRRPSMPFTPVPSKDGYTGFVGTVAVRTQPDAQAAFTADGSVSATAMFCPGTLGMARATEPDSANSQFFFMREAYPTLNGNYTVFGRVLSGQNVVRSIKVGEPPAEPMDVMTKVRIMADIPAEERPKILVMDTNAQPFRDYANAWRATQGVGPDVCKLPIPVALQP
jgi:peptidylprolyl isomerase